MQRFSSDTLCLPGCGCVPMSDVCCFFAGEMPCLPSSSGLHCRYDGARSNWDTACLLVLQTGSGHDDKFVVRSCALVGQYGAGAKVGEQPASRRQ